MGPENKGWYGYGMKSEQGSQAASTTDVVQCTVHIGNLIYVYLVHSLSGSEVSADAITCLASVQS